MLTNGSRSESSHILQVVSEFSILSDGEFDDCNLESTLRAKSMPFLKARNGRFWAKSSDVILKNRIAKYRTCSYFTGIDLE